MASTDLELPDGYDQVLADLKQRVHEARYRAQRVVNVELIRLYWRIGRTLAEQSRREAWGSRTMARLAADLRNEFPAMKGFSLSNLKYMRQFAETWRDGTAIGQQPVGQLPWGHVIVLMQKLDDQALRDWYAAQALAHGWSRNVLGHHIATDAHARFGAAPTNFDRVLAPAETDLAQQITKDPYVLDFLRVDSDAAERDVEEAMVAQITHTLAELGPGFAFVGRQVHFEVDDTLRTAAHAPSVGILLCTDKNEAIVRYALRGTAQPMAISTFTYGGLPDAEKNALPDAERLTSALSPLVARLADE